MNKEIKEGKQKLSQWLKHPNELGKKPFKVDYTNTFIDEDNIKCLIYKYKTSIFSKWYLGIVSESGTFSEMLEYKKETEIEDAKLILDMLKKFWKEQAKKYEQKYKKKKGRKENYD